MTCPRCKLENPPDAIRCDCGYPFGGREVDTVSYHLRLIAESVLFIKRVVLFWCILSLAGGAVRVFMASSAEERQTEELQAIGKDLRRLIDLPARK